MTGASTRIGVMSAISVITSVMDAMTEGGLVVDRGGRFASGSNSPALCAARSAVARPTQAFFSGWVASPEEIIDSMYPLGFSGGKYLGALPLLDNDCANAARRAKIASVE